MHKNQLAVVKGVTSQNMSAMSYAVETRKGFKAGHCLGRLLLYPPMPTKIKPVTDHPRYRANHRVTIGSTLPGCRRHLYFCTCGNSCFLWGESLIQLAFLLVVEWRDDAAQVRLKSTEKLQSCLEMRQQGTDGAGGRAPGSLDDGAVVDEP